jgi:hypothetical protein
MPNNTPFDRKLSIWNDRIPPEIQEASIMVHDTLELAWASARQIFGEQRATPEIAIDIFDLIQSQSRRRRRHTEES